MKITLKILLFSLFVFPFILIIQSCEDSLGYDPNVEITKIIKDTVKIDPEDPQTKFITIDKWDITFKEFYQEGRVLKDQKWDFIILSHKILIDTSNRFPKLWMEIDFANNLPDTDYKNRHDRVLNYRIKLAAELYTETIYNLNEKINERRWSEITMRDLRRAGGVNFIIPGIESRSQIILEEINLRAGYLNFIVSNDFVKYPYLNTRYFRGNIKLYFK
ncbi:MAG: hypothetical protein N2319_07990 [Candidatus Kapabacteria bacterium]|nr:hypothetical protein [Candidatus Kapabacteria bacterium]